jgi:hypothetical protein
MSAAVNPVNCHLSSIHIQAFLYQQCFVNVYHTPNTCKTQGTKWIRTWLSYPQDLHCNFLLITPKQISQSTGNLPLVHRGLKHCPGGAHHSPYWLHQPTGSHFNPQDCHHVQFQGGTFYVNDLLSNWAVYSLSSCAWWPWEPKQDPLMLPRPIQSHLWNTVQFTRTFTCIISVELRNSILVLRMQSLSTALHPLGLCWLPERPLRWWQPTELVTITKHQVASPAPGFLPPCSIYLELAAVGCGSAEVTVRVLGTCSLFVFSDQKSCQWGKAIITCY